MTRTSVLAGCAVVFSLKLFAAQPAESAVDWSKFLARHDLVWDSVPAQWHEGAFIGNGLLGAMIYAGEPNTLQWDVGRSDVIDRGQRMVIGKFVLTPGAAVAKGAMR